LSTRHCTVDLGIRVRSGLERLRYFIFFISLSLFIPSTSRRSLCSASFLNVIQIQVLTYVYDHLAFKLTDLENRRNDVLYEDSMIIKLFLFQFVNNYSSFYYLAFIAGSLPVPNGANKDSRVSYRYRILLFHFTSHRCRTVTTSLAVLFISIMRWTSRPSPSLLYRTLPALIAPLLTLCLSLRLSLSLSPQGQCGYSDCMKALAINLGIIFGTKQLTKAASLVSGHGF
jgi:hypothetical protein